MTQEMSVSIGPIISTIALYMVSHCHSVMSIGLFENLYSPDKVHPR